MAIYEIIKDCINAAQKADNIPLVQSLIDAQKQLLDLINENDNLKRENRELKENKIILDKIVRHTDAYITLKDDPQNLIYCSCCFDKDRRLVQAQIDEDDGRYWCPACKYVGYFDKKRFDYICNADTKNYDIF